MSEASRTLARAEVDAEHARGVVAAGGRRGQRCHGCAAEGQRRQSGRAIPRLVDREQLAYRRHAAGVVDVRVRDHGGGQAKDAAVPQERRDDTLAGVEPIRSAGAGVDQHGAAVGAFDDDRVALADVEHGDVQAPVGRTQDRPHRQHRAGQRRRRRRRAPGGARARAGGAQVPRGQAERQRDHVAHDRQRPRRGQVQDRAGNGGGERDDAPQEQEHGPHARVEPRGQRRADGARPRRRPARAPWPARPAGRRRGWRSRRSFET